MNIKNRLEALENQLSPDIDPATALAECDPLSVAFFTAEAYGLLGDTQPNAQTRKILQYIRQHPEQFPPMPPLDELLKEVEPEHHHERN